jgi:VWFA-related protein
MVKSTESETYLLRETDQTIPWLRRIGGHSGLKIRGPFLFLLAFFASVTLPNPSLSQTSSTSQGNSTGTYTIRLNTNLVVLSATVLNRHNALVSGLEKEDFQIYENHVLQQIKSFSHEDVPVAVGLIIDNSTSMRQKRSDVIAAALSFAQSSNPRDQMFVINFNEHVSFGLPPEIPFTDRSDQLQLALSTMNTDGETALYDAISAALDHLKQSNCDKKALILISDGGDNASRLAMPKVIEMARHSNAIIYAIGILGEGDDDQNPGVLKRFARETGGEAFFPGSSKEILSICKGIARDIRNQYTLAYVPVIAKRDSGYRAVDVRAVAPRQGRLSVRTRTGYFLPSAPTQTEAIGHEPSK